MNKAYNKFVLNSKDNTTKSLVFLKMPLIHDRTSRMSKKFKQKLGVYDLIHHKYEKLHQGEEKEK